MKMIKMSIIPVSLVVLFIVCNGAFSRALAQSIDDDIRIVLDLMSERAKRINEIKERTQPGSQNQSQKFFSDNLAFISAISKLEISNFEIQEFSISVNGDKDDGIITINFRKKQNP